VSQDGELDSADAKIQTEEKTEEKTDEQKEVSAGVSAGDLFNFYKQNLKGEIKYTLEDAVAALRDFDGSKNGRIEVEEFEQMVLPAANNHLRHLTQSRGEIEGELTEECCEDLAKLLACEFGYHHELNEMRAELEDVEGFNRGKEFENISGGSYYGMSLFCVRLFCESNGFYAMQTDLDAILRRFDHNANQRLDYGEYYELCTGQEYVASECKSEEN
jgi:hypothetical protein